LEPGHLSDHNNIYVPDQVSFAKYQFAGPVQQQHTRDPFVGGICIREQAAYIAKAGCSQQSIDHCMTECIRIRVTRKTVHVRDLNAPKHHLSSLGKRMEIES
jgi:hypothetical protein